MRSTLIIVFLIILVGPIDGIYDRSSPSIVNTDTKELYLLIKKLWSASSNDLKRANKRMCQILIECCSSKTYSQVLLRTIWAANTSNDPFIAARAVCMASPIHDNVINTCPQALSLNTSFSLPSAAVLDMNTYQKYQTAVEESIKLVSVLSDFHTHMAHVCNSKEIYRYLCALNYKILTSCINKILRKQWQLHSTQDYHVYVRKLKTVMSYMRQIMNEFEQKI